MWKNFNYPIVYIIFKSESTAGLLVKSSSSTRLKMIYWIASFIKLPKVHLMVSSY